MDTGTGLGAGISHLSNAPMGFCWSNDATWTRPWMMSSRPSAVAHIQ